MRIKARLLAGAGVVDEVGKRAARRNANARLQLSGKREIGCSKIVAQFETWLQAIM